METGRDIRLSAQLSEMEQRWKLVQFAKCGGYALLLLLAALAVGAALDYVFALSMFQRRLLSVACYGTVISYAWFGWLRPFWRPLGPRALAWLLEGAVPDFNEKLISAVEFSKEEDIRTSRELIEHVLDEAEVDLLKISPRRVFPLGKQHFLVPAIALTAFIVSLCIPHLKAARLIRRVVYPSVHDATVGRFDLSIVKPVPGARAEGDTIAFVVRCTDPSVRDVKLCVRDHRVKRYKMRYDERTGLFIYSLHNVRRSMDYWATRAKVTSARHHLRVDRRQKIESFTVYYKFPPYTGLPESATTSTSGDLRAYRDSTATLEVKATVPLQKMIINGHGCRSGEEGTWQRSLPLGEAGTTGRFRLKIERNGSYSVTLRDMAGLENLNPLVYSVVALDDKAPTVDLNHPTSDLYLDPGGAAALAWAAEDDFGIDHVELHYTVNGAGEKFVTLDTADPTYSWPMRAVQCGQGDEIAYFVRVYDASGHSADSRTRRISIVGTQRLRNAGHFVASARSLHAHLASIRARLAAAQRLYDNIRSARNHPQRVLADTIAHNLKVMREHHVRLAREIAVAEAGSKALSSYGFFPRSRFYGDMMARYFRQERLFFSDDDLGSLARMLDLTSQMTDGLIGKAAEQVPRIQLDGIALSATSHTTPGTRAILIRQADDIARSRNTIFANDFKSFSRKQTHGLRGEYYRATDRAAFSRRTPGKEPDFTRLDHSLLFPNSESFGAGAPPFSVFWSGFVAVRSAGVHSFFLSLDGWANLFVDGHLLVAAGDDREKPREKSGQVTLQPGLHTVHLEYANRQGNGSLALHWAAPGGGKLLLTKPALFSTHPKAFESRLRALTNFVHDRAADYRELDRIAQSIRENIKSTDKRILDIARELELYNRETDWDTVRGLSEEMAKVAAAGVWELAEVKQHRDFTIVGEVLERAAIEKDIQPLRAAAKAMPRFEQQAEVRRLHAMVESAAHAVRIQVPRVRRKLADKRAPALAPRELDGLLEDLRAAHQVALGVATFGSDRDGKQVADALKRAEISLSGIRAAMARGQLKATEERLVDVVSAMKAAEDAVRAMVADTDDGRRVAHDALAPFAVDSAQRLGILWDEIGRLPGKLRDPAVTQADMSSAARDVETIADGLAAVANRLRMRARARLQPPGPDIAAAGARLAIATALDSARTGPLAEAGKILVDPPAAADDCAADASRAAGHLERALNAVDATRSLVARSRADQDGALSAAERRDYEEDLARLMDNHLAAEVRGAARAFTRLDDALDRIETLAGDAAKLRSRPDAAKAKALARDADSIRRGIDGILDLEPRDARDTPPREPPQPLPEQSALHLLDTVTRMRSLVTETEAAATVAARLRQEIHPAELQAIRLLDEVPVDDLDPAGRAALGQARRRVGEAAFDEKARQLQAVARMLGDRDPGLKKRLGEMAVQLNAHHATAARAARLDAHAARMVHDMHAATSRVRQPSRKKRRPRLSPVQHTLAAMADNIAQRDFDAVRRNLETIQRDLGEPAIPPGRAEPPDPDKLVSDGVEQLKAALRYAPPANQPPLAEAIAAAGTGKLERATMLARDIAGTGTGETEIVRGLTDAVAFDKNTVQPLKKAITEARANRFARSRFYAEASQAGRPAVGPLETARSRLQQAAAELLADAHSSGNHHVAANLAAAARAALAGDIKGAIGAAGRAGKDGERHVGALRKAVAASADALAALERAQATADKASVLRTQAQAGLILVADELKRQEKAALDGNDKKAAAAIASRRAAADKAMAHLKQGDLVRAGAGVRHLAGGAVEAADAVHKFEAAAAEKPKAAIRRAAARAEAETRHRHLAAFLKADGAPAAELLAAASKAITAAREKLAAGAVDDKTVAALSDASAALSEASGALVHTVLTRHTGTPGPNGAGHETGGASGGNGGNGSGLEIPLPPNIGITDPWAGASGALSGGDSTRLKTEYNDYYRKAIQKYFEKIPRRR